ncbi:putative acanthoscurrin-1-like [Capsicum annuum]|nr:putative acanthoscurrin-1-like [Capsicum annuum]KAF3685946.1 putative acanthoscurrin-1-like [Capsicum annuum]
MASSLKFQMPILFCLFFFLSPFSFYGATAYFFNVYCIDEMIDPLTIDCVMNGNIKLPTVSLKQSGVHKYPVDVNTGQLEPTLSCNMTSGPRYGNFPLFQYNRDIPRCEIKDKRCTWNIRPEGLFLFYDLGQHLIFEWSMRP